MKISFIGQKGIPATFGGIEAHVEALSTRLAARGHEVDIYVRSWYTDTDTRALRGVSLKHVPTIHTKHLDATLHSFLATVDGVLRGYDVLHFHAVGPGSFAGLAALTGRASVLTVHSLDWERAKWGGVAKSLMRLGTRIALASAREVIAVSLELVDYLFSHYDRKAHHIPNGVELPELERDPTSDILARLGLQRDAYFLFLGRFVPEKRLEKLVDAFRSLGDPRLTLVLAGDASGPYAESIRDTARDLRCLFPGVIQGDDKEALLRGARAAVLPSELEGLPIFLLEAMARGVPVVASDLPPHRELLADGRGHAVVT